MVLAVVLTGALVAPETATAEETPSPPTWFETTGTTLEGGTPGVHAAPRQPVTVTASSEERWADVRCDLAGAPVTPSSAAGPENIACTAAAPDAGAYELRMTVTRQDGVVQTHAARWSVDLDAPALRPVGKRWRWQLRPRHVFRWRTSDRAGSGISHLEVLVETATTGGPLRSQTVHLPATARRWKRRAPRGGTSCLTVTVHDRAGHFRRARPWCRFGALDDAKARTRGVTSADLVHGKRLFGGSATALSGRARLRVRVVEKRRSRSLFVRARVCRRCGMLDVRRTGEAGSLTSLRRPRARWQRVRVRSWYTATTLRLGGINGRVVVDGIWLVPAMMDTPAYVGHRDTSSGG